MQAAVSHDARLRPLLQPLLSVRHAHLQPLEAIVLAQQGLRLCFGQPGPCDTGCDGVAGAIRAVHEAGLWVGDVLSAIGFDDTGRVVVNGVGAHWDLTDPFAGHPSVHEYGLRIRWRQQGDLLQLVDLAGRLITCENAA